MGGEGEISRKMVKLDEPLTKADIAGNTERKAKKTQPTPVWMDTTYVVAEISFINGLSEK